LRLFKGLKIDEQPLGFNAILELINALKTRLHFTKSGSKETMRFAKTANYARSILQKRRSPGSTSCKAGQKDRTVYEAL
jgi:trimethylamine:corrinoid methyltransferase-like protein